MTPQQILRELDKVDAADGLSHFVKLMWHVVEPVRPLTTGWVQDAIYEHLQAVTAGQIKRLLINVPPGFQKSLTVDVFYPAWEWGPKRRPDLRYVCASYNRDLTIRDNLRFRRVIQSEAYVDLWGDVFSPSAEQFNLIKVSNDKTGWKFATSVGGTGTGERGDRFIIDDGNNVLEAESEAILQTTNSWLTEVVPDRLNDQQTSAIINIQQRTSELDVSGTWIEKGMYDCHLCIPNEYEEARRCVTVIGWQDPRTVEGELAWPERLGREATEGLRLAKGPYAYAGQYQQSPVPRGGGIIKREWWNLWPPAEIAENFTSLDGDGKRVQRFPDCELVIASVDTAYTEKEENDWSACTIWGIWRTSNSRKVQLPMRSVGETQPGYIDEVANPKMILMDGWQSRLQLHDLVQKIIATCRLRKVDALLLETQAVGISVAQEIGRLTRDGEWQTILIPAKGDKVARMHAVVPMFSGGLIYAPDRRWADMVIDQVASFPKAAHDDLADTVSMAVGWVRRSGLAQLTREYEDDQRQLMTFKGQSEPVYGIVCE